jgi:MoaA/NifB/PqqE/SkfB family radical SAM enzyme
MIEISAARKKIEQERREKLKREKPRVYEKFMQYEAKRARGESTAMIDFCFDYKCNMKCVHCSNLSFAKKDREMTISDLRDLARQADELGLAQFVISGGEPLTFDNLDEIILALDPQKFNIAMSTNGLLLDKKMARHLKEMGVDKIKISLDSIDESIYEKTRGQTKGYRKAIEALFNCKEAGLQAVVQTVMSHQTCRTDATERLAMFCQDNDFNMDIIAARAIGRWEGKEDVLLDEADTAYLVKLKDKYPMVHRDVFPTYGETIGACDAVTNLLHITKYGDVLPCVFIHIAIGNIFSEQLKDIIKRGMSIKYFSGLSPKCLSGEDREFVKKYMSKFYGKPLPIHWSEAFEEDDFVK